MSHTHDMASGIGWTNGRLALDWDNYDILYVIVSEVLEECVNQSFTCLVESGLTGEALSNL
jgi:hypothetical protein